MTRRRLALRLLNLPYLQDLSPRQQVIFTARVVLKHLTQRQLAQALRCSLRTVKYDTMAARRTLTEAYRRMP